MTIHCCQSRRENTILLSILNQFQGIVSWVRLKICYYESNIYFHGLSIWHVYSPSILYSQSNNKTRQSKQTKVHFVENVNLLVVIKHFIFQAILCNFSPLFELMFLSDNSFLDHLQFNWMVYIWRVKKECYSHQPSWCALCRSGWRVGSHKVKEKAFQHYTANCIAIIASSPLVLHQNFYSVVSTIY